MQWEAPWMPTAAYDSCLLPEQETPLVIGTTWCLWSRDSSRWIHQNPRLFASIGRASGRNENRQDRRSDYYWHAWTKDEEEQWGWNFSEKAGALGMPRASADYNTSEETKQTEGMEEAGWR